MCLLCKRIGEHTKLDEAMLLPNVHKEFEREVLANVGQFPRAKCITENELPNSRWLLSQLHVYFEDKLDVQCRHKRYGIYFTVPQEL